MKIWVKCAVEKLILDVIILSILSLAISGFRKIIFRI
jgi:hypothetical protein